MVFDLRRDRSSSLYFADLLGASLGALDRHVAAAGAGRRNGRARRGAGAVRRRGLPVGRARRSVASAAAAAILVAVLAVTNETLGPAPRDPRHTQGHAPADGRAPVSARRADRVERLLAHRRRRRVSGAVSRAAVHRLRRLDEHPRVGRQPRQRARHAHLVSRAAVQARAQRAHAGHRPGRRLRRARRARVGQPQGHARSSSTR